MGKDLVMFLSEILFEKKKKSNEMKPTKNQLFLCFFF